MSSIWELDLPPSEKLVLLVIADHADDDGGNAYPSVARIARRASISERQTQRVIRQLCDEGFLIVEDRLGGGVDWRSDRRPNRYQIIGVSSASSRGGHGVTSVRHEVTLGGSRGDIQGTHEVTPMSPYTSIEPSIEPSIEISCAESLCELLADSWASLSSGVKRPKVTKAWVDEMDRMMRLDGRDAGLVEEVLRWLPSDSFWSVNVGSPVKLRKHFDRLILQMRKTDRSSRFSGIEEFLKEEL
jgi:hypothetical protein